jgi:hypothetical protein
MRTRLFSLLALMLLISSSVLAQGLPSQKVPEAHDCCFAEVHPPGDSVSQPDSGQPVLAKGPCACHAGPVPVDEPKPVQPWLPEPPECAPVASQGLGQQLPDLPLVRRMSGVQGAPSSRAPPCPLYRLYGVCLN